MKSTFNIYCDECCHKEKLTHTNFLQDHDSSVYLTILPLKSKLNCTMLEELFEIQVRISSQIPSKFRRFLFEQINWDARCIGIIGARGVGKTTLVLQYFKENFSSPEECLYFSADHVLVAGIGLYNIARHFFALGGSTIIIDEIHKYPSWGQELKNIIDSYPEKRVIFTGSSSLHILKQQADLSRRAVTYTLPGLSFREYLAITGLYETDAVSFYQIIKEHVAIAAGIASKFPVLKAFREYLNHGYYPFFMEGVGDYMNKLANAIEKVFYEDIPSVWNIKPGNIVNLKRLTWLIASSQPFIPNIDKLSRELRISKEYIYIYLEALEKAGITRALFLKQKGFRSVRKPSKIYLNNPNLYKLFTGKEGMAPEKGAVREAFFISQAGERYHVYLASKGDFLVGDYLIEVGGTWKSFNQVKDAGEGGFLFLDDREVGAGRKIPLYLAGLLY